MQRSRTIVFAAVLFLWTVASAPASALLIGFEEFTNGEVVADGSASHPGFTLSVTQNDREHPFDVAVAFDTGLFSASDPDLAEGSGYAVGNLAPNPNPALGNILILQEDRNCEEGFCDTASDWGRGTFLFEFDETFDTFSFDLIDIEGQNAGSSWIEFYKDGVEVGYYKFIDFICHPFFLEQGIEFGDHSANRIDLGMVDEYDSFRIKLSGGGGIDNLNTTEEMIVPEPGTASLLWMGLAGLVFARRRPIA